MKQWIKSCFNFVFVLLNLPMLLLYLLLNCFGCNKNELLAGFSQFYSLLPGKIGTYFRVNFFRFTLQASHPEVVISFATVFSQTSTKIEAGVYIGPQCNIGACVIEKDCLIGSGVHILSGKGQHNFDDLDTPIREQGGSFEPVTIGEDTWIGNGAIITANIGKKCIIGAGAVVTKDIPDFSIAVGNPAKVIKQRK